ncbi:MAG: hypothetical protein ABJB05_04115 [Parafilimonas sp.]
MKAIETYAVFDDDGNMIIENLPVIKNKKVKLLILINEESDKEFYDLSAQGLYMAYSTEEPDYNKSLVQEPNADYAGR